MHPSQEIVRQFFTIDPTIPEGIRWKVSRSRRKAGDPAGILNGNGYYHLGLHGKYFSNHTIIWIFHKGEIPEGYVVDHKNRVKTDNYIDNYRLATKSQNNCNRTRAVHNKSGVKGVSWDEEKAKWKAQIYLNRKPIYLGHFAELEDARAAVQAGRTEHHGEFAHEG